MGAHVKATCRDPVLGKAPPFHSQTRRVELARQHLKAAAGLLLEARTLHRCEPSMHTWLTGLYRDVCDAQSRAAAVLASLIDEEVR